jgi:hypothetical protein
MGIFATPNLASHEHDDPGAEVRIYKDQRGVVLPPEALMVIEERNRRGMVVAKTYRCAYCLAHIDLSQLPGLIHDCGGSTLARTEDRPPASTDG